MCSTCVQLSVSIANIDKRASGSSTYSACCMPPRSDSDEAACSVLGKPVIIYERKDQLEAIKSRWCLWECGNHAEARTSAMRLAQHRRAAIYSSGKLRGMVRLVALEWYDSITGSPTAPSMVDWLLVGGPQCEHQGRSTVSDAS